MASRYVEFTEEEERAAVAAIIAERAALREQVAALQAEVEMLRELASRGAGEKAGIAELAGLMFGEGWEDE